MGLSSSQARLLSLTGRQHDIEYKAQKLEAQKLQMANESTQVYSEYEDALNASKVQLKTVGLNGASTYIDATYNNLVSAGYGVFSPSNASKVMVSQADIDYFNNTADGNAVEFACLKSGFCQKSGSDTVLASDTTKNCTFTADKLVDPTAVVPGTKSVSEVSAFTSGDTYNISTVDDLNKLSSLVNSGADTIGVSFALLNNLDMSTVSNFAGIGSDSNAFNGTFNGNGYAISNLSMNSSSDRTGLFGYATYGATIQNVGLTNVNIQSSGNYVGGLVGSNEGATIQNVGLTNVNIQSSGNHVGGLVGYNEGGTITNSYATGIVSGLSTVGGLVGFNYGGTITNSYATGTDSGSDTVGGLAGYNCYGTITNSYATANVSGSAYVGGLAGFNYGTITNSYATANVSGSAYVGGLAGCNYYGTTTNCVYNSSTNSTGIGYGDSSGATGLTLSQMQDQSTMEANGFTEANGWSYSSGSTPTNITKSSSSKYDPSGAPNYQEYLTMGNAIKSNNYFLKDGHENDASWLANLLSEGLVVLSKIDSSSGKYHDTNVATDPNLQEVSDDTNVKKAEAKYESSMAKIDAKDKKYDTDIATLETERNAIKTEIDTIKTVSKDNVERTFKLFS